MLLLRIFNFVFSHLNCEEVTKTKINFVEPFAESVEGFAENVPLAGKNLSFC
jgi:hypothetical protein